MYALDAADGQTDYPHEVINLLIQALLQYVHHHLSQPNGSDNCIELPIIPVGKGT